MSDMKPKRPARLPTQGKILPEEAQPVTPSALSIPQAPTAPEVISAPPTAVAEPEPELVSAAPVPAAHRVPAVAPPPSEPHADSADDAWNAVAAAQAVLARGLEEAADEVGGMTRSGIAAAADAAVALLGVRTFSDAVEINAMLARRGVDAMIEGTARLSEIGIKAVSDASRPILSRFAESWSGLAAGPIAR